MKKRKKKASKSKLKASLNSKLKATVDSKPAKPTQKSSAKAKKFVKEAVQATGKFVGDGYKVLGEDIVGDLRRDWQPKRPVQDRLKELTAIALTGLFVAGAVGLGKKVETVQRRVAFQNVVKKVAKMERLCGWQMALPKDAALWYGVEPEDALPGLTRNSLRDYYNYLKGFENMFDLVSIDWSNVNGVRSRFTPDKDPVLHFNQIEAYLTIPYDLLKKASSNQDALYALQIKELQQNMWEEVINPEIMKGKTPKERFSLMTQMADGMYHNYERSFYLLNGKRLRRSSSYQY